jgi:uncharacterized protein
MASVLTTTGANPAPLGLAGFGLTTVVLSAINAGLLNGDTGALIAVVVPLAFSYGGLAQIIAGAMEYCSGNTFGMVAFTSYGLLWWWYALLLWTSAAGWIKPPAGNAVGLVLLMWGIFTLGMWIAAFRANRCVWLIFLLLWITFFLLAGSDLGMGDAWHRAGGWLGLLTGLTAMFTSFVEVLNATFRRDVIPLGAPILRDRS